MTVAQGTPISEEYAENLRWLAVNQRDSQLSPHLLMQIALYIESLYAQLQKAQHACDVAGADPEHALDDQIFELRDENAALSAQVVELQKDAERYAKRRDEEWWRLQRALPAGENFDRKSHARSYDAHSDWLKGPIDAAHSTVTRASVPPSVSDGGTHTDQKE